MIRAELFSTSYDNSFISKTTGLSFLKYAVDNQFDRIDFCWIATCNLVADICLFLENLIYDPIVIQYFRPKEIILFAVFAVHQCRIQHFSDRKDRALTYHLAKIFKKLHEHGKQILDGEGGARLP